MVWESGLVLGSWWNIELKKQKPANVPSCNKLELRNPPRVNFPKMRFGCTEQQKKIWSNLGMLSFFAIDTSPFQILLQNLQGFLPRCLILCVNWLGGDGSDAWVLKLIIYSNSKKVFRFSKFCTVLGKKLGWEDSFCGLKNIFEWHDTICFWSFV